MLAIQPEGIFAIPLPVLDLDGGFGFTPWGAQPDPTPAEALSAENYDPVDTGRVLSPSEERKLRRMISNRESARRSRKRKQRHLEDLRCQMNQLVAENRDLVNRLGAVSHYCLLFRRDNDRLRAESSTLSRRLSEIRRILLCRQLQRLTSPPSFVSSGLSSGNLAAVCGGYASGTELNTSSLIV